MASEQQPNSRRDVDYRNFPPNVAYIALSDVRAAYEQGRADAEAELNEVITDLRSRLDKRGEQLHAYALERNHGIPHDLY